MTSFHCTLILALSFAVVACDRSQPSGVPEPAGSSPVQAPLPETASNPSPVQVEQAPAKPLEAPPPLEGDIPPYAKTGFPDCDDYVEEYRQCLNSQLAGAELKAAAHELTVSVNSITANISRGVEPSRVASRCKKSRRIAAAKLETYGCSMQAP